MKPARNLLLLLGAWLIVAVPGSLWPEVWLPAWKVLGLAIGGIAILDGILALRLACPALERPVAQVLPVGAWSPVELRISNPGAIGRRLAVFDGVPGSMDSRHLPWEVAVGAGGFAELTYQVRPNQRGPFTFARASMLMASPLGLWWRHRRAGAPSPVKVFPNFAPVKHFAELARGHRLAQMGIHKRRLRGEGSEFHQLRDFREGDSLRQLDWKATARLKRLISRDYQEERDQQVVCLVDCGRRMRARDGRLSHFDHILTGLLLLTFVALREGDAVGLLTFGGPERYVPPRKTQGALDGILDALYDVEPSLQPTDYVKAAQATLTRIRKRSLIVVITNLRDEDDETLGPALRLLARRHKVILASMREPDLDKALQAPVVTFQEALRAGAIHAYLDLRRRVFDGLTTRGCAPLDVLPQQLPVALANRYLAEKRAGTG